MGLEQDTGSKPPTGDGSDSEGLKKLAIEPFDFSKEEDKKRFEEIHDVIRDEVSPLYTQIRLANSMGDQEKSARLQTEINDKIKSITEQAAEKYKEKVTSIIQAIENWPKGVIDSVASHSGASIGTAWMDKNELLFLAASLDTPLFKHKKINESYLIGLGEDFYYTSKIDLRDLKNSEGQVRRLEQSIIDSIIENFTEIRADKE